MNNWIKFLQGTLYHPMTILVFSPRFGLGRKPASELSPGSGKMISGLVNPQGQPRQQPLGGQMGQQQSFNIQVPKTRKSMVSTLSLQVTQ